MEEMQPPAKTTTSIESLDLDEVAPEDRNLVSDVISVLSTLQHPNKVIKGYIVSPKTRYYEVQAFIDTKNGEWEVGFEGLDVLKALDLHRVRPVTVRVTGQSAQIVVGVLRRAERVMVTEHDVIRVQRKRRWLW